MTDFFYLIPIAIMLGVVALGAFMWSLRSGQYDDLAGAAERILFNEHDRSKQIAPSSKTDQADRTTMND